LVALAVEQEEVGLEALVELEEPEPEEDVEEPLVTVDPFAPVVPLVLQLTPSISKGRPLRTAALKSRYQCRKG
jgi:hypothetical protein